MFSEEKNLKTPSEVKSVDNRYNKNERVKKSDKIWYKRKEKSHLKYFLEVTISMQHKYSMSSLQRQIRF